MKFVVKLNFTFDGYDVNEEQFEINIESEVIKILLQSRKKLLRLRFHALKDEVKDQESPAEEAKWVKVWFSDQ